MLCDLQAMGKRQEQGYKEVCVSDLRQVYATESDFIKKSSKIFKDILVVVAEGSERPQTRHPHFWDVIAVCVNDRSAIKAIDKGN